MSTHLFTPYTCLLNLKALILLTLMYCGPLTLMYCGRHLLAHRRVNLWEPLLLNLLAHGHGR